MKNIIIISILLFISVSISSKRKYSDKMDNSTYNEAYTGASNGMGINDSLPKASTKESQNSYTVDGQEREFSFIWNKRNKKKLSSHWSGFGMSFMNYSDSKVPNGTLKMSSSHNFTLNLMSYGRQLGQSNFLVVSGLGFDWSRYHFDTNAALTKIEGTTLFEPAPEGINYKSTKLLSYYITIPLMLEYQNRGLHMAAGAVCYFKYYSKSQVKYYDADGKHKENMGRDLNIRPIDLRLRAQVGIDNVSLFGTYAPSSMFKKNKGPEMKTYAIGAMIHF